MGLLFRGEDGSPKFMVTFPFPYMNGRLHLGHSFSLSKAEFAAGFERLRGKKTLFPFAFHCTGMPIKACADKLVNELSEKSTFPGEDGEAKTKNVEPPSSPDPNVASKHSKVQAKTGNMASQFKIMESIGIPVDEIPKFSDPQYWLDYFPPKAIVRLKYSFYPWSITFLM